VIDNLSWKYVWRGYHSENKLFDPPVKKKKEYDTEVSKLNPQNSYTLETRVAPSATSLGLSPPVRFSALLAQRGE